MPGNKICGICGSADIEIVYTAPLMPLGAQVLEPDKGYEAELFYPLHYALCHDCGAFQSMGLVPDNLLRSENKYFSAISKSVIERDYELFLEIQEFYKLGIDNFIIDVGGSDGTFLKYFSKENIQILNIEPVREAANLAEKSGIKTIAKFLNEKVAAKIVADKGKADLVVAKQVLELVPDLHRFLKSCTLMLSENGKIMMEVPYVKDLLDKNFYDLIAHLRMYHYSLTSIKRLFSIYDLTIERVIHYEELGGGLRFYAGWKEKTNVSDSVRNMLLEEEEWGVKKSQYYKNKLRRGIKLKRDLLKLVDSIKEEGKRIAGFGAGIKASTLLNFCGLDKRYIDYLVDSGKHKQGKLMPGVRVPIYPPEKIDNSIDYVLICAWLHQDEIVKSLKPFIDNGGKVIIPTPQVEVYSGDSSKNHRAILKAKKKFTGEKRHNETK